MHPTKLGFERQGVVGSACSCCVPARLPRGPVARKRSRAPSEWPPPAHFHCVRHEAPRSARQPGWKARCSSYCPGLGDRSSRLIALCMHFCSMSRHCNRLQISMRGCRNRAARQRGSHHQQHDHKYELHRYHYRHHYAQAWQRRDSRYR